MGSLLHWRRALSSAFVAVASLAAWAAFAPAPLGGQASYIIVAGASMEPALHRGDLVVALEAPEYRVGDIVTYRHPDLGPIIHRVLAQEGDRYAFQGDNNDWVDSYHPSQADLIGKLWIRLPGAGKWVGSIREPKSLALMAFLAGTIIMGTVTGRRQRERGSAARGRTSRRGASRGLLAQGSETWLFVIGVFALSSVLLAAVAFTRPTRQTVFDSVAYDYDGEFTYTASAPSGVYDTEQAQTGDPIFRRLTDTMEVTFAGQLRLERVGQVSGTQRLMGEVSDANGWKRTFELEPWTAFESDHFTARGTVDLTQVQALIDNLEAQTGVARSQYTLAVVSEASTTSALSGEEFRSAFSSRLEFRLENLLMALSEDAGPAQLRPSEKGFYRIAREEASTIGLFVFSLPVLTARWLSALGLALSLVVTMALGLAGLRLARSGVAAQIKLKYGHLLLTVREVRLQRDERLVELSTIEDLARMAEKSGRMILYYARGSTHHYLVRDGEQFYHYARQEGHEMTSAPAEDPQAGPASADGIGPEAGEGLRR